MLIGPIVQLLIATPFLFRFTIQTFLFFHFHIYEVSAPRTFSDQGEGQQGEGQQQQGQQQNNKKTTNNIAVHTINNHGRPLTYQKWHVLHL
jgi:hypothetical protein